MLYVSRQRTGQNRKSNFSFVVYTVCTFLDMFLFAGVILVAVSESIASDGGGGGG